MAVPSHLDYFSQLADPYGAAPAGAPTLPADRYDFERRFGDHVRRVLAKTTGRPQNERNGPADEPTSTLPDTARPAAAPAMSPAEVAQLVAGVPVPTSGGIPPLDGTSRRATREDFANNLLAFGLATMAAGSRPGASTLGAIGQGGLAALNLANQRSKERRAEERQQRLDAETAATNALQRQKLEQDIKQTETQIAARERLRQRLAGIELGEGDGDARRFISRQDVQQTLLRPDVLSDIITASGGSPATVVELLKDRTIKAPTTRTRMRGTEAVQEEFDSATGQWREVGRGPRFNPKEGGPTQAQTANNAEIDAARGTLAGLGMSRDQILRASQKQTDTGRENPAYDPYVERLVRIATQRKVGVPDQDFKGTWGKVYGTGKPAAASVDTKADPLPMTAGGQIDAKRLRPGGTYAVGDELWRWDGSEFAPAK
jgi:hypothetical protein